MGDIENNNPETELDSGVSVEPAKRFRFVQQRPYDLNPDDESYREIKQGTAIIFNHKFYENDYQPRRDGTDIDVEKLKEVLALYHFKVTVHTDFTRKKIRDELDNLRTTNFDECDCLAIFVLTHGAENSLAAQDDFYKPEELWGNVSSIKCPTMAGKPKLIFINACRGHAIEHGTEYVKDMLTVDGHSHSSTSGYQLIYTVPIYADILVAFSTFEGYISHRHPQTGSWFIQSLCEALMDENINKKEIKDILTRVSRMVALRKHEIEYTKQVPVVLSTLIRNLFLK